MTPQTTSTPRRNDDGFSLLDILVAIIIFMLIAMIGASTLSTARKRGLEAQERSENLQEQIRDAAESTEPNPQPEPETQPEVTVEEPREPLDVPWTPILLGTGGLIVLAGGGVGGASVRRGHLRRAELAGNIRGRWNAALAKHDAMADEYATLRLDPIAAIDHMALWDVTDPFTEKFTLAYAKVADTRSLHLNTAPTQAEIVDAYAADVDAAHLAWVNARDHARDHGIEVLSPENQTKARRAKASLKIAANDAATEHERSVAAETAADLLASLRDIRFPAETSKAIVAAARKQITAA